MKTSTIIAMAFAMIASSSSAMPSPLSSDFNSAHSDKKGGFTLHARQDEVPSCSVPCIQNAIAKVTDCDFTDYACACKYHGKVTSAATSCVVGSCGLHRALKAVVPAIRKLCEREAQKDNEEEGEEEEEEKKAKRGLEVVEEENEYADEFDLYDGEFDEYADDEEMEEQAKRQLIVPDKNDLGFDLDPIFDEEE